MTVFLRILMIVLVVILAFCTYLVFSSLEYLAVFLASFVLTVASGILLAIVDKPKDSATQISKTDTVYEQPECPQIHTTEEVDLPTDNISVGRLEIIPQRRNGGLAIINSNTIQKHFVSGDTVSLETLKEKGIIRNNGIGRIKIVVTSQIHLALDIEADLITTADAQCFIRCGGVVKKYR